MNVRHPGSISERPSRRSGAFAPTTSRTVGRMSTVSAIRSTTSPRCCPGSLPRAAPEGCRRDCASSSRLAPGAPLAVTRAVIGGDDDESLVVRADFAQPADHIADETIGESDLRQMPLVKSVGVGRAHSLEQPSPPVHPRLVVRTTVTPSGRDVLERHMRQHQMDEVQARRSIVNRRHEMRKHSATAAPGPPPAPHASGRIPPIRRRQAAGPR